MVRHSWPSVFSSAIPIRRWLDIACPRSSPRQVLSAVLEVSLLVESASTKFRMISWNKPPYRNQRRLLSTLQYVCHLVSGVLCFTAVCCSVCFSTTPSTARSYSSFICCLESVAFFRVILVFTFSPSPSLSFCLSIYLSKYLSVSTYPYIYKSVHVLISIYLSVYLYIYIYHIISYHIYTPIYMHTDRQTKHTHIHTCIHTYTY